MYLPDFSWIMPFVAVGLVVTLAAIVGAGGFVVYLLWLGAKAFFGW